MSVPGTREPQKIHLSQIIHEWVEVIRGFQTAGAHELKLFVENVC